MQNRILDRIDLFQSTGIHSEDRDSLSNIIHGHIYMSNSSQIDRGDIFTQRFPVTESDIIRCRIKFWIGYTYFNRREFILKSGIPFPISYMDTYICTTVERQSSWHFHPSFSRDWKWHHSMQNRILDRIDLFQSTGIHSEERNSLSNIIHGHIYMSNSSRFYRGDIFTDRFPVIESDIIRCRIELWIE